MTDYEEMKTDYEKGHEEGMKRVNPLLVSGKDICVDLPRTLEANRTETLTALLTKVRGMRMDQYKASEDLGNSSEEKDIADKKYELLSEVIKVIEEMMK